MAIPPTQNSTLPVAPNPSSHGRAASAARQSCILQSALHSPFRNLYRAEPKKILIVIKFLFGTWIICVAHSMRAHFCYVTNPIWRWVTTVKVAVMGLSSSNSAFKREMNCDFFNLFYLSNAEMEIDIENGVGCRCEVQIWPLQVTACRSRDWSDV